MRDPDLSVGRPLDAPVGGLLFSRFRRGEIPFSRRGRLFLLCGPDGLSGRGDVPPGAGAGGVAATRPLDEDVQISSQVIATTTDDSGPTRVTVTLELTVSIDGAVEAHVTLSVVELLLVADEPGWLVGSLERIA